MSDVWEFLRVCINDLNPFAIESLAAPAAESAIKRLQEALI